MLLKDVSNKSSASCRPPCLGQQPHNLCGGFSNQVLGTLCSLFYAENQVDGLSLCRSRVHYVTE